MISEKTRNKLKFLHEEEDLLNIEMANINKEIKKLQKRNTKLALMVSKNMKQRNKLIFEIK